MRTELKRRGLLYSDAEANQYINTLGQNLAPGFMQSSNGLHFYIIKSATANAMALPNGDIYVNNGLLSVVENEDQLAAILAHEISHVIQRHSLKSMLNRELSERGYDVVEFDLEKAIGEDDKMAYAVNQAREGFQEARQTLYETALSEQEKRKFKVSVGTTVNIVSEKSGADAVLLMHYIGMKKSGGVVAKDVAVGVLLGLLTGAVAVAPTEASYVEFAFIDGVTGDVLWSNVYSASQLDLNVADMVMQSFPRDVDEPVNGFNTKIPPSYLPEDETDDDTDESIN